MVSAASHTSLGDFGIMPSYTPQTNLWVERSRLAGMVLASVSYGVFLLLTVQTLTVLMRRPRCGRDIVHYRFVLIFYIVITFILGTISTAVNAKYTEMIWIDLRDAPGGPLALIQNVLKYRINVVALCCGHIQEWFMQAMLLHRCFVIWDWAKSVMIPMVILYVTMIGMSIIVQVESSTGAIFYNLNTELAYLCVQVGLNVIYTILVVYRLLSMRNELKRVLNQYDSSTYDTVVLMIVESAMAYTITAILFIFAFALHDNGISTMCFMSIGKVQGIAQLLIILRAARGRGITYNWSTRITVPPTTVAFSHSVSDGTEEPKAPTTRPEQDVHEIYPISERKADTDTPYSSMV